MVRFVKQKGKVTFVLDCRVTIRPAHNRVAVRRNGAGKLYGAQLDRLEALMPINIPLDHMVVTFHFTTVGAAGDSVITLGIDQSSSTATSQQDLQAIFDAFNATVMTRMPSACTLTMATAIATGVGGAQSFEVLGPETGFLSGALLPANTAWLIQKLTGFAGKKNRGRCFLPAVPAATPQGINPNLVDTAQLASMQTQWDDFRTGLVTADLLPVILHQQGVADPPRMVTQFVVSPRFATQRGRMRD